MKKNVHVTNPPAYTTHITYLPSFNPAILPTLETSTHREEAKKKNAMPCLTPPQTIYTTLHPPRNFFCARASAKQADQAENEQMKKKTRYRDTLLFSLLL